MDKAEFTRRMLACESKMYRAAVAILGSEADACDAAQEAIAKAFCKRTELRDNSLFETWLMRILINECKDILRRHKRFTDQEPEATYSQDELWLGLDVRYAMSRLPEKYRIPVILHYYDEYTIDEISRITGQPGSIIKSRLNQARKNLKDILGGDYLES